jgi:hypothetical protein
MATAELWLPDDVNTDEARPLEPGDPMVCHVFRNQLKQVDPARLDLIRTAPQAQNLPPNRWLIVYRSEDGLVSWFLIQNEDGFDCLPDERHWDRLMEFDQARSHGSLLNKFRKERDLVQASVRQEREDKSAEFREKLGEAFSHILDPKVAISERAKELVEGVISEDTERARAARQADKSHTAKRMNRRQWH